tara:strand:- start:220 stop:1743 length:1524 start_codon:yes stop_codon:yes gene_type:complete
MAIKFDVAKGHRDWYGVNTLLRDEVRDTLRSVFERYGFVRIETPIIEDRAALGFKGGGEIQAEAYKLSDQGERELALRFDQTVPLARFLATHREIKLPFKRYVIGEVFRDGPTQPEQGRFRSFTQCDADTVGVKEMSAEAEFMALAKDAFQDLGLGDVEFQVNNRKLLDGILDFAGVPEHARPRTVSTLDKMDKVQAAGVKSQLLDLRLADEPMQISNDTFDALRDNYDAGPQQAVESLRDQIIAEVTEKGYDEIHTIVTEAASKGAMIGEIDGYRCEGDLLLTPDIVDRVILATETLGDNNTTFHAIASNVSSDIGREGLDEVWQLLKYADAMGFDFVKLNPALARGLDYYTGTTIEVYLQDRSIVDSAILAGGRFDDMVGDFRGAGEDMPAVGFSFGLERLVMVLKEQRDVPQSRTQLYLIPLGETTDACLRVAHDIRQSGVNADMDLRGRKLGKAIQHAESLGIPYVGIVGDDEIGNNTVSVKNLDSGDQESVPVADVAGYLNI